MHNCKVAITRFLDFRSEEEWVSVTPMVSRSLFKDGCCILVITASAVRIYVQASFIAIYYLKHVYSPCHDTHIQTSVIE